MNEAFEKILDRLEEIKERYERLEYWSCNSCEIKKYIGMQQTIVSVIEIVQEVAEEYNNGWIPCSDRLPEPHILILVCENNGEIHLCRYHNKSNRYFYDGSDWDIKESEVIAWMPLPEPFMDDKNE